MSWLFVEHIEIQIYSLRLHARQTSLELEESLEKWVYKHEDKPDIIAPVLRTNTTRIHSFTDENIL